MIRPRQVTVRPLLESDLEEADRIVRFAFGTFLELPNPMESMGDAALVRSRWTASPISAFAAEVDGRLVGSNFATRWGSFGFFGPLTVDPAFWNHGVGSALTEPVLASLDRWDVSLAGLFTFAQSPKHIGLYQKFGFRPRSLTLVLEGAVSSPRVGTDRWRTYAQLGQAARREAESACRTLTENIYPGLDVTGEVRSIAMQSLGDTVLLGDRDLLGFAACHLGARSEAGSGVCYIKFGAVANGPNARAHFRELLSASKVFAARAGATHVVAGVNAARREAYEEMLGNGFRVQRAGVAMHRPNDPGFSRPGLFVIDDWR